MAQTNKETVLYYTPEKSDADRLLKGVLIRMGVRIKNAGPAEAGQTVGYLAGLPGFEETKAEENAPETAEPKAGESAPEAFGEAPLLIPERMLVLRDFGNRRLEEMLSGFRKAKVPPIPLKAVLTEHNCGWTLAELYRELKEEHEKMIALKEEEGAQEESLNG